MVLSIFLLYHDGPNPVHYNRDAVSTTDNFLIPGKSWLMIDVPTSVLHFICAPGGPATLYCGGVYGVNGLCLSVLMRAVLSQVRFACPLYHRL